MGFKLSTPLRVHSVYCGLSLRGIVIFSMKTQPGVEVTSVLFVSMALQLNLEMTNSAAAAGGARLSGRVHTQAHTGVLHFATLKHLAH